MYSELLASKFWTNPPPVVADSKELSSWLLIGLTQI